MEDMQLIREVKRLKINDDNDRINLINALLEYGYLVKLEKISLPYNAENFVMIAYEEYNNDD